MKNNSITMTCNRNSPERRIFTIDVGNIPSEEVDEYIGKIREQLKSNTTFINNSFPSNSISLESDVCYFPNKKKKSLFKRILSVFSWVGHNGEITF